MEKFAIKFSRFLWAMGWLSGVVLGFSSLLGITWSGPSGIAPVDMLIPIAWFVSAIATRVVFTFPNDD